MRKRVVPCDARGEARGAAGGALVDAFELLVLAQPGGTLLNKGLHLIDVAGEVARGEVVVAAGVIGALGPAIVDVEVLLVLPYMV